MLKYAELYIKIRETYPGLNWDCAICEAFMDGCIGLDLCYELLELYDKIQLGG